jgi:hypothetical protein
LALSFDVDLLDFLVFIELVIIVLLVFLTMHVLIFILGILVDQHGLPLGGFDQLLLLLASHLQLSLEFHGLLQHLDLALQEEDFVESLGLLLYE